MSGAIHLLCRDVALRTFRCSPDVAAQIAAQASFRRAAALATISWQGDAVDEVYLIVDGRAQAVALAGDGQRVLLHDLRSGDIFGSLEAGDAARNHASVVAVTTVDFGVFGSAVFVRLAETYGCIGLALSRMLIDRLHRMATRMYERSILSVQGRICAELLRLAGAGVANRISPAPAVAALAVQIQSTRESASRAVNMLERRGFIRREADALIVVAPRRLQELVV